MKKLILFLIFFWHKVRTFSIIFCKKFFSQEAVKHFHNKHISSQRENQFSQVFRISNPNIRQVIDDWAYKYQSSWSFISELVWRKLFLKTRKWTFINRAFLPKISSFFERSLNKTLKVLELFFKCNHFPENIKCNFDKPAEKLLIGVNIVSVQNPKQSIVFSKQYVSSKKVL